MNNKSISFLFLALLVTVAVFSCRKPDAIQEAADPENNYFPLKLGNYIIYDVDSTTWDDHICVVLKKNHQIMYRVADTFTDAMGRASYRIETFTRRYHDTSWSRSRVLYATNTNAQTEFVETELRYIKLVYPVVSNKTWLGNAFIKSGDSALSYFGGWNYKYTNVNQPYNSGDVIYNNTVTVEQIDVAENNPETQPGSFSTRTFGKEIYARNIGMVYREYYHWYYDPTTTKCRKGAGVVMKAVDYNY
jgi:hypothetical protein